MTALAIGAGAAVLGTGFQVFEGLSQQHKANQIEKSLKQPQYQIPSEFYQNREIARQLASLGLPNQVYNNQLNQIAGNQATAISAAQKSANPGAAISHITGQTDASINNLNAEDAQARMNNQRFFMDTNRELANQKLEQQQANVFDPYTQHYNEMQAYRGAGMQNLNTAFQSLGQLGGYGVQYALGNQPIPTGAPQTFGGDQLSATGGAQLPQYAPQSTLPYYNPQMGEINDFALPYRPQKI